MADSAAVRAWAREQGEDVAERGALPRDLIRRYEQAHPDEAGPADGGEPAQPQTRPREVRPPAGDRLRGWFTGPTRDKGKGRPARAKKPRPQHARVPVAGLIETLWSQLAWSVKTDLPPMAKLLHAQSATAGILLEGVVADTVLDRPLQAAARAEEKYDTVNGLIGPPVFLYWILKRGDCEYQEIPDPDGGDSKYMPLFQPDGMPQWNPATQKAITGLRFCMMSWLRTGQRHAADIIEAAEENERLGQEADQLIAWFLTPPKMTQTNQEMSAEAAARVAAFMGGPAQAPPTSATDATVVALRTPYNGAHAGPAAAPPWTSAFTPAPAEPGTDPDPGP